MGKLRMKETASERAAKETSSSSSRKEHRKKKRRKRGSTHDNDNDHDEEDEQGAAGVKPTKHYQKSDDGNDEDAYVPPRPSKDRPYVPYTFNDLDDESRLPSQNAHKRDRATEHEEFNQRLFDAMKDDEGLPDPYSNSASRSGMSFDYREALPDRRAFGTNGIANDRFVDPDTGIIVNRIIFKDAMTEEEYAEHVRRGMFRRTRKEEVARLEEQERARRLREKKIAEEVARAKALEAEKIHKLEERARRKAQAGVVKSRDQYQLAWHRLVDPKRADEELRSEDFPWPISPESGGESDKKAVGEFLTNHLVSAMEDKEEDEGEVRKKKKKQAIRTAVLAYHPDRFERYVAKVMQSQERESVRQMGLRISQILNELLQEM
ncbi:MAG: hypothetical protein CYPHOPRED_005066 [Cyphobasidiales sp. Tagirdzhanova-0007]|nr:MAG: hypothetical protein CYPHOPRED_005066 [Cyphobasidiales sp. Tagirdzhanova-0007]